MEKTYGELMSLLLQSRLRHGSESGFRAYVVGSVRALAQDLQDFGLYVSIRQTSSEPMITRRELNSLKVGCE